MEGFSLLMSQKELITIKGANNTTIQNIPKMLQLAKNRIKHDQQSINSYM